MTSKKSKSNKLLAEVLTALVREYGHEEVLQSLNSVAASYKDRVSPNNGNSDAQDAAKKRKATPTELVERSLLPHASKILLRRLAERFEAKSFLPSIGDVRHFLEMNGFPDEKPIQRAEAFRVVLKVIAQMPEEAIGRLALSHVHSGPSELAPLSQAIKAAGNAHRKVNDELQIDKEAISNSEELTAPPAEISKEKGDSEAINPQDNGAFSEEVQKNLKDL